MAAEGRDVTFTVLNFNGRHFLEVVLPSIFAQTVSGFAVHVLDNGSTDDSLAYLAEHWPQVRVLASPENLDVTRNMVRAIDSARTPYVAMLNNDLELDPRWLEEMLAEIERHPRAAAVDGKMLAFHRRELIDGAGDRMARGGWAARRGQGERDTGQYDQSAEVFSASAGACLYRRAAFDVVGPYDTDFIAYFEDVDWGFRARLLGFTARYAPRAVSYHIGSATTSQDPGRYGWLHVRNQLMLVVRNLPTLLLIRHAAHIAAFHLGWLRAAYRQGQLREHLRGLYGALRMLPTALRSRRDIQRSRVVRTAEIARFLH